MIKGVHVILFSNAVDETRAFLSEALALPSVDAGGGWPIFALPPAELAVHPSDESRHELFLMCDDLDATVAELERKGATFDLPARQADWGRLATMTIPGGERIAVYEPAHPGPPR